ncbi:unnamed protein product [Urochloa humidicola]
MGKVPRLLMGRYELGRLLGKGSFAKVYHARNVDTGEEAAIKVMDKNHLARSGAVQQQVMHEIEIMRRVRHPNVVHIHEVMATKWSIFVVMEFIGGGSVDAYLNLRTAGRGLAEPSARRVFHQLVSALDYCHSLGVYHRDIKPDNILVDGAGNIKVADFGLSALIDAGRREAPLHTVCGTPMFIAPEVFLRGGYDGGKADVWACGVVLFALAAGRFPFNQRDTGLYHLIRRCDYHCPPWFSDGLVRLIRRLLCPDPARRITMAQIKKNSWFKKGFKEIPWSLSELEKRDFDSDDDLTVSLESSPEVLSSLVARAQPRGYGGRMHTSVSAPSLTTLKNSGSTVDTPLIRRPKSLNAFDIIASSPSLNLTGLFEEPGEQMRFVSTAPVPKIIAKLEEIAEHVSFTARTKEYQVSIGGNGDRGALLVSAKVFELTPDLAMVKVCKKAGDITEYRQFCNNELKPGLRGLVDGLLEDNGEPIACSSG